MNVTKDSKNKKKKVPSSGYIAKAIPHGMIQVGTADDGTKIYSASALIMRLFYPELYKLAPNKTNYIFTGNGSTYTPIKAGDDRYTKFIQNDLLRSSQPIGPEIVVYGKLSQKSKVEQSEDKTDQGEVLPYSIYDPEHPGIKHNLELLAWTHEGRDAWLKAMDALVRKTAPSNHPFQLLVGATFPGLLASSLVTTPTATLAGLATYPFGKLLFNDIWSNINRPKPISGMNMAYVGGKYADLGYFTPHQLLPKEARGKTWDEQVSSGLQKLGISEETANMISEYTNPGGIAAAGFGVSAVRPFEAAALKHNNSGMWIRGWRRSKLGNKILETVDTYKQTFPYMKLLITDNNAHAGLGNTVSRTIKSIPKFASPKFMNLMLLSPDMINSSKLYWWSDFNKDLWKNFLNNWAKEAAKGEYNFAGATPTPEYSNSQIANAFETARHTASGIKKAQALALDVINNYRQKLEAVTDPVLKHIAEVSPLYLDEVYAQLLRGGSTPDFVRGLIKRANSYRRAMRGNNLTSEDFLTYKGRASSSPISTIDVEGEYMSGNYGPVQAYFEGQPKLEGDMSTWWDLRIPLGINSKKVVNLSNGKSYTIESRVTPGMHSVEPYMKQITALEPKGNQLPIVKSFYDTYYQSGLPEQYINYPTHQVFYGRTNTVLPNFKVTIGSRPFNFNYGKGYKQGGIINKCSLVEECK